MDKDLADDFIAEVVDGDSRDSHGLQVFGKSEKRFFIEFVHRGQVGTGGSLHVIRPQVFGDKWMELREVDQNEYWTKYAEMWTCSFSKVVDLGGGIRLVKELSGSWCQNQQN